MPPNKDSVDQPALQMQDILWLPQTVPAFHGLTQAVGLEKMCPQALAFECIVPKKQNGRFDIVSMCT